MRAIPPGLTLLGAAIAAAAPAAAQPCGTLPALHVAPEGDDVNDGSAAHPLATLQQALLGLQGTALHTVYLHPGSYRLSATVVLGPRQSGVSILGCPPRPATLDGQGRLAVILALRGAAHVRLQGFRLAHASPQGTGLELAETSGNTIERIGIDRTGTAMVLRQAGANRITACRITASAQSGIEAKDGSNDNLIDGNLVDGAGAAGTTGGGLFLHGASRNRVTRNIVAHSQGMGIGVLNWDDATINIGNAVTGNVVRDTDLGSHDSGAIYVLGRSRRDTRMEISDNWIDGTGSAHAHSVGIYLDDSTNGVTVRGNVIRNIGSDGVQIHGGSGNVVTHNVIDLGPGTPAAVLFQAAPADTHPDNRMAGNVVSGNVIVSSNRHPRIFVWLDGGAPAISGNLYFNAAGVPMHTYPPVADSHPLWGDPRFGDAGHGDYTVHAGSALRLIGMVRAPGGGALPSTRP
jgi:parallel beta-helix repeat protein